MRFLMIIGLTGPIASGKTTVAKILQEQGFEHHTYSDILRQIAKERGIAPTRTNLQALGTEMKAGNPGVLSRLIVERSTSKKIVADGVRTVEEIDTLRAYPDVRIFAVDAPQKTRYARLSSRARDGDPLSYEDFLVIDNAENSGKQKGQSIHASMRKADFVIENDGDEENLRKQVLDLLKK